MKFPLNQILYGAPGTGKTFKTKELAVEIITGNKVKDREELTKVYDELKENNQINFTTFHQSISYEDFVEGIKPVMDNIDSSTIQYEIKKGIFKEMCSIAQEKNANNFEDCYSKLIEELIGIETLELETPNGYKFSISLNRNNNLSLYTGTKKLKQGTLTKENILKQLNGENKFDGWEGYFNGIINYLKVKYNFSIENSKNQQQKYVLIIDEINRGNISAIFGELITLIEEDKRKGILKPNTEVLEVELPYSREKFSVPDNLYIIGTMNTADRSVESLDTALRRRFSFVEMQPNLDILKDEHNTNGVISIDGSIIDMVKMLEKINKRIEILIDKDHKIGHSFFINIVSFEDLQLVFKDKIIPLLEEYFFGDFGKIGLVLGENFIKNINTGKQDIFAKFDEYEDRSLLTDKLVYEIKNPMNLGAEHFISIYE
jgi:5-methylcytosine-specific restriction protein B